MLIADYRAVVDGGLLMIQVSGVLLRDAGTPRLELIELAGGPALVLVYELGGGATEEVCFERLDEGAVDRLLSGAQTVVADLDMRHELRFNKCA